MQISTLIVIVVGCLSFHLSFGCSRLRSTEEFKELFIGKCVYYQEVLNPSSFCESPKNCTELWHLFTDAFAYKPRCDVDREGFRRFVEAGQHPVPSDKFIFWEDVYSIVTRYTNKGRRLVSISDTLVGYIGDDMKWCGNSSSIDGIEEDYQNCPGYEKLPNCNASAERSFWTIASEYYAKQAEGKIYIMMNAARKPAFEKESYFATWELPNIVKAHTASILMVHPIGNEILETCNSDSIRMLKNILNKRGIRSECTDNPRDVLLMQCADSPSDSSCQQLYQVNTAVRLSWHYCVVFVLMLPIYLFSILV